MKILLINIDSEIPNLALAKIEKYHFDRGDEIIKDWPMARNIADKIYVSCVFTKNKQLCHEWEGIAEIGGTGYDIYKKLPPYIEATKPKINWGFTTRGCIRKCEFCFVPEKEGMIHAVGDIYDIWDGESKEITIMDNNILAMRKHFIMICDQLIDNKLKVDFNQGLDIRLVDDEIAHYLSKVRQKEIRFAMDHISMFSVYNKKLPILRKYLPNTKFFVYVLVGFDSTFEEDIKRLEYLKKHNCKPYVMRYETVHFERQYIRLAEWANQQRFFAATTFDEFLKLKDGKKLELDDGTLFI